MNLTEEQRDSLFKELLSGIKQDSSPIHYFLLDLLNEHTTLDLYADFIGFWTGSSVDQHLWRRNEDS